MSLPMKDFELISANETRTLKRDIFVKEFLTKVDEEIKKVVVNDVNYVYIPFFSSTIDEMGKIYTPEAYVKYCFDNYKFLEHAIGKIQEKNFHAEIKHFIENENIEYKLLIQW